MLCLKARGKINWTLDITGRRKDGYHLMDMLMQSVELHDTLWMETADDFTLQSAGQNVISEAGSGKESSAPVPFDESNLVFRAAKALWDYTGTKRGAKVILQKGIPSGAGMGGGSADAAAALIGLNRLWGLELDRNDLLKIGLTLGADVPFMLTGGLARVSGIGEIIRPVMNPPVIWLTLWQPCDGLSTGEIFSGFDGKSPSQIIHPDNDAAEKALTEKDLANLGRNLRNVLEAVSAEKRPQISKAVDRLRSAKGCYGAAMTGSGSVVYGVFGSQNDAETARKLIEGEKGFSAVTCSAAKGVSVL